MDWDWKEIQEILTSVRTWYTIGATAITIGVPVIINKVRGARKRNKLVEDLRGYQALGTLKGLKEQKEEYDKVKGELEGYQTLGSKEDLTAKVRGYAELEVQIKEFSGRLVEANRELEQYKNKGKPDELERASNSKSLRETITKLQENVRRYENMGSVEGIEQLANEYRNLLEENKALKTERDEYMQEMNTAHYERIHVEEILAERENRELNETKRGYENRDIENSDLDEEYIIEIQNRPQAAKTPKLTADNDLESRKAGMRVALRNIALANRKEVSDEEIEAEIKKRLKL